MKLQYRSLYAVAVVLIAGMAGGLAGCGGGGGGGSTPDAQPTLITDSFTSSDPQLSNGSYVHIYRASAASSGTATVEMDSNVIDSYLAVFQVNNDGSVGNEITSNDDISSGNLNSRVSFGVSRGSSYYIVASSPSPNATGGFALTFSSQLNNVSRVDIGVQSFRSIVSRGQLKKAP